jgi:hypothetical protein
MNKKMSFLQIKASNVEVFAQTKDRMSVLLTDISLKEIVDSLTLPIWDPDKDRVQQIRFIAEQLNESIEKWEREHGK